MKGGKGDPKSKGKGKGTLFSFFSKAPSPASTNSATPSKLATKPASNTPSTAQSTPVQSSGEVEDLLGKRIKVLFHILYRVRCPRGSRGSGRLSVPHVQQTDRMHRPAAAVFFEFASQLSTHIRFACM